MSVYVGERERGGERGRGRGGVASIRHTAAPGSVKGSIVLGFIIVRPPLSYYGAKREKTERINRATGYFSFVRPGLLLLGRTGVDKAVAETHFISVRGHT